MKRTLLVAAALLGAVGCGGSNSGEAVTYTYAPSVPLGVPAQTCKMLLGPIGVGNGWMHYAIDDLGARTDAIEAVILSDSYFSSEGKCGFTTDQAILDVSFSGSSSGDIRRSLEPPVLADTYDFVVTCGNTDTDCAFALTWSATY